MERLNAFYHRFTQRTIKVIFDGALGSRGAALLAPYSDKANSGFLTQKPEELRPMFEEAVAPWHSSRDARDRRPR